jgi:hypothetical protein
MRIVANVHCVRGLKRKKVAAFYIRTFARVFASRAQGTMATFRCLASTRGEGMS